MFINVNILKTTILIVAIIGLFAIPFLKFGHESYIAQPTDVNIAAWFLCAGVIVGYYFAGL